MHDDEKGPRSFDLPLERVETAEALDATMESAESVLEPLVDRSGTLTYNLHGNSGNQIVASTGPFARADRKFQGHFRSTAVFVEEVQLDPPQTIDVASAFLRAHGRMVRVNHGLGLGADKGSASASFKVTTAEVWTKPPPEVPRDLLFITRLVKLFPPQKEEDPKGSLLLRLTNITTGQHIGQRTLDGPRIIDLTSDTIVARKGEQLRIELIHQCHHKDETLNSTEADWALAGAGFVYGILRDVTS